MMSQMSRGEMIRRLDTAVRDVHDHLENGPLTTDERHALATSLSWLLPIVADTLQDQEDTDAARALVHHGDPPAATSARLRADVTPSPTRPPEERERLAHAETRNESPSLTAAAPAFHAEKPILTTHPVNGGDALIFPITPPPPQWWWRALRCHATTDATLLRPWDQEHESRIAVVCPPLDQLADVMDAIDAAVQASNRDYDAELALEHESAVQLETDEAERSQYHSDIRRAIDARYDHRETGRVIRVRRPPARDKPEDKEPARFYVAGVLERQLVDDRLDEP
jgi:hypothetical protein